jgi:hypothetical protein
MRERWRFDRTRARRGRKEGAQEEEEDELLKSGPVWSTPLTDPSQDTYKFPLLRAPLMQLEPQAPDLEVI